MSQYKNQGAHLIRVYGTKDEIERLDAGVLPEDEFDMIVGDVLFEPVLDLPVRQKMKYEDIRDLAVTRGKASHRDEVTFEVVEPADELSAEQWARLKAVRALMSKGTVDPFYVVATCGEHVQKFAHAKVQVTLGERVRRLDLSLEPLRPKPLR
jgi:hypothetical protein